MKNKLFYNLSSLLILLNIYSLGYSQIKTTGNLSLQQVQDYLFGPGVQISNFQILCPTMSYGSFDGTQSNIGIPGGVILTTGKISDAGTSNNKIVSVDNGGACDADLNKLIGKGACPAPSGTCTVGGPCTQTACAGSSTTNGVCTCTVCGGTTSDGSTTNTCAIEFDLIPSCDSIQINYVFASEEYDEFVCSTYNDVFAFFITGPNPAGGTYNKTNIALVPGTNTPVAINSINNGTKGASGTNGGCTSLANSNLYVDNSNGATVQYYGFTKPLLAKVKVTPCKTYHMKIAIADVGDAQWDSGVFLQKNGVACSKPTTSVTAIDAIEGCKNGQIQFKLTPTVSTSTTINYSVAGTATSGTDYTANLTGTLTIPANQSTVTIPVTAIKDNLVEGCETIIISVTSGAICTGTSSTSTDTLFICDPPIANAGNDVTICPTIAGANLTATGGGTYSWSPTTGLSCTTCSNPIATPAITTTYIVTTTDAGGCTATDDVTISIACGSLVTAIGSVICDGGTGTLTATGSGGSSPYTYSWSPATTPATGNNVSASPTATTVYTVIATDNDGKTATATATVVVNQKPTITLSSASVCPGGCATITASGAGTGSYSWSTPFNGSSSTQSACPVTNTSYSVTGTDANGCTNTAIATVTVDPIILNIASVNVTCFGACNGQTIVIPSGGGNTTFTYSWSSGCINAACNNICAGSYTLTATNGLGCTATGSTIVTEPPLLTVINVKTDVSCFGVCDGTAAVTANGGNAPYNYSWVPSGGAADNASGLCAGTYTCTITDANNCSVKTSVTINQPKAVVISSVGASLCPNECATLIANGLGGVGAISYSWSPGGMTSASVSVCPITTTPYALTGTDANGCSGGTSVTVTVNPTPVITVPAATICEKTSTTLTASGANTYMWSPATGLSNPAIATPIANPATTTTYTVIGKNNFGCTASTTVIVTVNPASAISSLPASICLAEDTTLTVSGAVSYSWVPSGSLSSSTGSTVTAKPINTTTYTITGTSTNGCTSTTTVIATVNPKPIASFTTSPQVIDEFNPTVYFYDNSVGGTMVKWNWSLGDSANTLSALKNPFFTYPSVSNTYPIKLIVTNQFGCVDTVTGSVYIRGIFTFYIPNTFTPNSDGNNDIFLPRGVGIDESDYHLWIFDRWGNLIWQTGIWGEAWNGKANGGAEIAEIDTYVWKVHVKEKESGVRHNYIGHVNIVK